MSNPLIDLTGKKFGRLFVLRRSTRHHKKGFIYWDCKCDCGNLWTVIGQHLRRGTSKSCGCLKSDLASQKRRKYKNLSIEQWSKITGIGYRTIATRLHRGWGWEKTLNTPVQKRGES